MTLGLGGGFVFPDHFLVPGDFLSAIAVAEKNIVVGQQPTILRRLSRELPLDRTIGGNDGDLVALVIAAEKTMARCVLSAEADDGRSQRQRAKSSVHDEVEPSVHK